MTVITHYFTQYMSGRFRREVRRIHRVKVTEATVNDENVAL